MHRMTSGRYRDLLRNHDYRLLAISSLVDESGSWGYAVVLAVYVFDRTHSTEWLAATMASRWITGLLVSGQAGVIADRFERTKVLFGSALCSITVMTAIAVTIGLDGPPGVVIALAAVAAAVAAPYPFAASALTPQLVNEDQLAAANSLNSAIANLVVVIGPAIGGLLLLTGKPVVAIALNAASFGFAALISRRLHVRTTPARKDQDTDRAMFRQGVRAVMAQRSVLLLMMYGGLASAIYATSTVVYVPLSGQLGTGTKGYSYLLAACALGGVLGAPLADRLSARPRLAPVMLASVAVQAVPFLVSIWAHTAVVGAVLQVVSGSGMIVMDVLALTTVQRDIPNEMLSRALAVFDIVVLGSVVAASYLAAGLLSASGLHPTLAAIGIGFPVVALLGTPALVTVDRRSAARVAELRPRVELLEQLDLFDGIERPALERLAAAVEVQELSARVRIIRAGDPADALWVLVDGSLSVTAIEGRRRRKLPEVTAPGFVGELGLLHGIPRTATVTTQRPSTLWRIPASDFLDVLESAPASRSLVSLAGTRMARTPGSARPSLT